MLLKNLRLTFVALTGILALASSGRAAPWAEFADIEHQGKCPAAVAAATSPDVIATWDQERLDVLYACSKAGPIPDGFLKGKVVFAPGGSFDNFVSFSAKIGVPLSKDKFRKFAETLWKGKHFYKKDKALLNKIGVDAEPLLGHDIKGQMRFPAKLFCGQSLLDSRRESIIIDYAYSDTVKIDGQSPFDDKIDWIAAGTTKAGKRGLAVRDEIRMVKPGFYLGRAYMDRAFVLNFILSSDTPADGEDTCWPGYTSGA